MVRPGAGTPHFSFDVFDTAVCRLVDVPDHLHFAVGRALRQRGLIDLEEQVWHYARVNAEFRQRLTLPHREVTLPQIYARLAEFLLLEPDVARAAMDTEVALELRTIRPVAAIRERVLDLAGTEPLFLSDTYFSSQQVVALLERAGYPTPHQIVASCEHGRSKWAGDVYAAVAADRGIAPTDFVHIGDNDQSDVVNAQANGWNATLFPDSRRSTRERIIAASGNGEYLASVAAGSARAARLGQTAAVRPGIATAAATVGGPLLTAYVLWVVRDVVARGGRRIHFLARDGQVLAAIARRLVTWLGVDVDVRYTLASRQAFLLAAVPDADDDTLVEAALRLAWYDRTPVAAALLSLRFTGADITEMLRDGGIDPGLAAASATDPDVAAVRRAMRRPDLVAGLRARADAARAATLAYLESEQLFADPRAAIVDLGWRGTTQLRLQQVVGERVELVGYYLGLTNTVLGPRASTRIWTDELHIKTSLLETLTAADHTSVTGFGLGDDGRPAAVPPPGPDTAALAWGAREQQEIILRFADYFCAAADLTSYPVEEVASALRLARMAAYRHFCVSPTREEAEAYGAVRHADDVNHLVFRELAQVMSSRDTLRHVLVRSARGEKTTWFLGSVARSGASVLPRLASAALARALLVQVRLRGRRRRERARRTAVATLRARLGR